ncbi:hypothetical protein ACIBI7_50460 [Nonomuraea fuscirosea]|uniref:hypothetical protein n=1 Tax=Nonomuraea fuscirosea TaxID=1291556 RepID=UPI003795268B
MALDETTEKLFRAADASTLLALLPLLRRQIEWTAAEMKRVQAAKEQDADADAQLAEASGEALTALHTRLGDDPDARDAFQGIREKFNSVIGSLGKSDQHFAQYMDDLFRYVVDLTERERWIISEMKRRGYLPFFAGEEQQFS